MVLLDWWEVLSLIRGALWAWDPDLAGGEGQLILMSLWETGVCKYGEN